MSKKKITAETSAMQIIKDIRFYAGPKHFRKTLRILVNCYLLQDDDQLEQSRDDIYADYLQLDQMFKSMNKINFL
jgi:hypothetical protein